MMRKSQTEIEIPRIGMKVQRFLGLFYLSLFLVSSFCMFVPSTRFLVSSFCMFVLSYLILVSSFCIFVIYFLVLNAY